MLGWLRRRRRDAPELGAFAITLTVDGTQVLFVMMAADGSINRMGTGAADNDKKDVYIGVTDSRPFEELMGTVGPELLSFCGQSMAAKTPVGKPCELLILFMGADGEELVTQWRYGLESAGPPAVIQEFVRAAVAASDPWFVEQWSERLRRG